MALFHLIIPLLFLTEYVTGESFDGRFGSTGSRSFVAPDIPDDFRSLVPTNIPEGFRNWDEQDAVNGPTLKQQLGQIKPGEVPSMSEFNYYGSEAGRANIMSRFQDDLLVWNFHKDSEVSSHMTAACRKCMMVGNFRCVANVCRHKIDFRPSRYASTKDDKLQAFVTGTSLYGDILCSLCKKTNDVTCTMKHCVDPERDKNGKNSGVECNGDFCRWEKEAVINTGFNNYYHAWWQPQNLYFFFDQVTKEITSAYVELISSTSEVINGLG